MHSCVGYITKIRFTVFKSLLGCFFSLRNIHIGTLFQHPSASVCIILLGGRLASNPWLLNRSDCSSFVTLRNTPQPGSLLIPLRICLNIFLGPIPRKEFFLLKICTSLRIRNILPNRSFKSLPLSTGIWRCPLLHSLANTRNRHSPFSPNLIGKQWCFVILL